MGKKIPIVAIRFPESFMALTWPKWTQQHPKIVGLFSHSLALPKKRFPTWKTMGKCSKIAGEEIRPLIITKMIYQPKENEVNNQKWEWIHTGSSSFLQEPNVKENGEENMKTWKHVGMGRHFLVFTAFPKKQWLLQLECVLPYLSHPKQWLTQPIYGSNKWLGE